MKALRVRDIVSAAGGRWTGEPALLDAEPGIIVTDSREVCPGCLFIAIRGERTDGHIYIPEALSKGALAVLCEEAGEAGERRIVVPSVADAIPLVAALNRLRFDMPFVGITGSVGKTTGKEMVAAVLSARYNVFKTPGSLNGQIGVPLTMFRLRPMYEAAVIEMGISYFGEMRRLTQIVHPDMAVFMNIGDAHLEFLGDRQGVLKAKCEILEGMGPDAVILCNGDDEILKTADFGRRTVRFGLGGNCDVWAENIEDTADALAMRCVIRAAGRRIEACIPAYGDYMIYSALAGAAVGIELGLTDGEIAAGIAAYETVGHRSRIARTSRYTIIDDCYNANPSSCRAALTAMTRLSGRRVCILGDMRELGGESPRMHREIGAFAVECGAALVLTCGDMTGETAAGAGRAGRHFPSKEALLAALPELLQPGDVVLIKASRGAKFEELAEALLKD